MCSFIYGANHNEAPSLRSNVFPRSFPRTPSCLSTSSAENRFSPSKCRKVATKRHIELHKLLDDAKIISSNKDDRLKWLDRFSSWLKLWNKKTEKHLTKEASTSLIHTVDTRVLLVTYLLQHHKLQFVLLGKFQTDNLEARFGQYSMLSGSNYLVSVNEVLQGDNKLTVHGLLKFYTESQGIIRIKDSFMEISQS